MPPSPHSPQVTGELSTGGRPMRAFVQTFVLAPESPKKYYVHNDIFRYQDDDLSESETNELPGGWTCGGRVLFLCFGTKFESSLVPMLEAIFIPMFESSLPPLVPEMVSFPSLISVFWYQILLDNFLR